MRKASVENFIYHERLKLSSFMLLNGHCFQLEVFPNSVRCHWVLRDHMASNNETVSCQNLRGGNIAKSMITSGKQKEGSLGRYYNLVPRVSLLASRKNQGCGWSRGSQNLGAERKGGEKINNYRYDKSYSVQAQEKIAASFIISRWCGYQKMSTRPEKIALHKTNSIAGNEVSYSLGISCASRKINQSRCYSCKPDYCIILH